MTVVAARIEGETDLERLVSRSRLLGADPALVVHGGGNTSTKLVERDHLERERPVLRIKATGADLATATAADFVGLYLDDLLELRRRETMTDAEVVAFLDRCKVDPSSKRPSIETLLHAFLPATHVDHVHSDAICALTNTARCNAVVQDALGDDVVILPYVRPGFRLAKLVDGREHGTAIVLRHHGLVTWGDTHEETLHKTCELEERAREYLRARGASARSDAGRTALGEEMLVALLPRIRGALSRREHRVLHTDRTQVALANRDDVDAVATAARATPDHMLWIGRQSAVVHAESWEQDIAGSPRALLVPGLGCIGVGADKCEARKNAEIAGHSHRSVASTLDALGEVSWLDDQQASEFLSWPLELYKLGLEPPRKELQGRVILVTGAASGIGREVALELARLSAHVVAADVDADGLRDVVRQMDVDSGLAVAADLKVDDDVAHLVSEAVKEFGGIDAVVSNAGVAVAGRLADLSVEDWQRSLAVNATAHFLVTRHVWPVLEAQRMGGSLVYIASKNAFSPGAGFGAYSAAKAAEVQLARIAALEGGPLGIRANVVNPDAVFSGSRLWSEEMRRERALEHGVEPEQLEAFYASRNLLQHEITGADVAEAVVFLLSPRAAATTGCVITVDGGVPGAFPR